jgi:hypothetical protein
MVGNASHRWYSSLAVVDLDVVVFFDAVNEALVKVQTRLVESHENR